MNPQMLQKMMPMMMGQLKVKNPTMANQVQEMINNGGNPMNLLKQVTSNFDEKTRNDFFNQARQIGFNDDFLNQIKNGINTK